MYLFYASNKVVSKPQNLLIVPSINRLFDTPDPFGSNGNMDTGAIIITSNSNVCS